MLWYQIQVIVKILLHLKNHKQQNEKRIQKTKKEIAKALFHHQVANQRKDRGVSEMTASHHRAIQVHPLAYIAQDQVFHTHQRDLEIHTN